MAKTTFTLDDETLRTIRKLAERRRKPQSLVVREAVAHYAAAEDKLSPDEQAHMLSVLEDLRKTIPTAPVPLSRRTSASCGAPVAPAGRGAGRNESPPRHVDPHRRIRQRGRDTAAGPGDHTRGPPAISSLVLHEWICGHRAEEVVVAEQTLFGEQGVVPFGADEAGLAADIYRQVRRPRGREMDIAIAACAIGHRAALWTLNERDFEDIPGLMLYRT